VNCYQFILAGGAHLDDTFGPTVASDGAKHGAHRSISSFSGDSTFLADGTFRNNPHSPAFIFARIAEMLQLGRVTVGDLEPRHLIGAVPWYTYASPAA
jgi:hypothetical protein